MFRSEALLRSYLRLLHRLSGAEGVDLYFPARPSSLETPLLLHLGEGEALPELTDAGTAEIFVRRIEEELGPDAEAHSASPAPLYQLPSTREGGRLIRIPSCRALLPPDPLAIADTIEPQRRRHDDASPLPDLCPPLWVGLRFAAGSERLPASDEAIAIPAEAGPLAESDHWWTWLLALGGALAGHSREVAAILLDTVTELPGRVEFEATLRRVVANARARHRPVALLLVNPNDFAVVNERFGHQAGDRVMREIAQRLRGTMRQLDLVNRYGGAVFAVILPNAHLEDARAVAEKLRFALTPEAYLDGAVRLAFSLGAGVFEPADDDSGEDAAVELLRRADQALRQAQLSGDGAFVAFSAAEEDTGSGPSDRLTGIFTANLAKDYRNMLLLWDAVGIVGANPEPVKLAQQAVERLFSTFKPARVTLFTAAEGEEPEAIASRERNGGDPAVERSLLGREQHALLTEVRARRQSIERSLPVASNGHGLQQRRCYAVPMVSGRDYLGCLYLDGLQDAFSLDASDLIFLEGLAGQLAAALDRAYLAARERGRQDQERRQLRAEVKELRQALEQSKLIYRSPEMEALLETVRRVAPTEATVLINGESGTGKELLARTVHELSPRRGKRLVVVDCGAITASLIESELFGHERGAYTGAQERRDGRLVEADGGTVVLDEVGELPLEVQSKLLRFVQERELTPVGGRGVKTVDVRLVAVTNRDLAAEVAAGRFREDLYHRLNVVRLALPPLRERPDDVLLLADHFLRRFSLQYQKGIRRLHQEAETLLAGYSWPGNVRELQNRILQAVILCGGDEITAAELGLEGDASPAPDRRPAAAAARATAGETGNGGDSPDEVWAALRLLLRHQVETTLERDDRRPPPLARWLADDLVLEAQSAAEAVASRAASLLGVPETTFRRRLGKALADREAGLTVRLPQWEAIPTLLARLVRTPQPEPVDLLRRSREVLLEEVLDLAPDETRTASALMAVTPPTLHRWRSELSASS